MSKEKSIGFFPSERNNFIFTLLIILLVVLIIALFANLVYLGTKTSQDRGYVKSINNLRVYSQSIAANAAKALDGDKAGFSSLDINYNHFVKDWAALKTNISPTDANSVDVAWQAFKPNIDTLLSRRAALSTVFDTIKKSRNPIAKLREISRNTLIVLTQEQSDIRTITSMQEVALLIENIQHNLDNLLTDYSAIAVTSATLTKQINSLKSAITRLQQKGALPARAQRHLQNATPLLAELNDNAAAINLDKVAGALIELQGIDEKIFSASQSLLTASSGLAEKIEQATAEYSISAILNYVLGALIILVIVTIAISIERNTRKRLQVTATENSSNQEAILQLLDEIGDLADGDLTVNATVSEAFTGAIADSINYSIEQLRDLVETINHTSEQVSEAAETSQNVAMNLAEAAEHQAGEIAGVSDAIIEIARSIDQVSNTAKESEGVAQRSVEIAHNGNEVVHHAIAGMDTIREQIQDTAKRIKRLGESSQEIGNIVGLIDDIAEQTNILALNAAIQASMAGDAGRGFAVVADEVQRLAERSSSATKQIEMLVKTIQTDTNEAVISMEQTTSEVVRGAKLAENAGVALEEIENVSQVLAKLIQTISLAARQQSSTASHVARTMSVVQEITYQTASGSTEAAMIIGRLTTMARDMRTSVSGFKLPK